MTARRIGGGLTALVAAVAVVAVPALATNVVKFDSKIRIAAEAPAFHGGVHSEARPCIRDRKVRVFKAKRGTDKLMGRDRTNRRGHWRIIVDPLKSGTYYAKVIRREEGAAGTIFVCRGDVSRRVTAD